MQSRDSETKPFACSASSRSNSPANLPVSQESIWLEKERANTAWLTSRRGRGLRTGSVAASPRKKCRSSRISCSGLTGLPRDQQSSAVLEVNIASNDSFPGFKYDMGQSIDGWPWPFFLRSLSRQRSTIHCVFCSRRHSLATWRGKKKSNIPLISIAAPQ